MRTPLLDAFVIAVTTVIGVESTSAHGQETTTITRLLLNQSAKGSPRITTGMKVTRMAIESYDAMMQTPHYKHVVHSTGA